MAGYWFLGWRGRYWMLPVGNEQEREALREAVRVVEVGARAYEEWDLTGVLDWF